MKKLSSIIMLSLSMLALASCSMFKLDNFDGPNAQVTGQLIDKATGERMGVEATYSSEWSWATWSMVTKKDGLMTVIEQGWKDKDGNDVSEEQDWYVRFDGKYTNNRVFAASYKVNFKNMPCYQLDNPDFTLAKGANTVDFQVTPFCRIKNESITYANGKITATFSVELGDAAKANKISNVAFCGNTQLWVGCNFFNLVGGAAAKKANVTPGDVITLEIDTTDPKNGNMFQYEQERYVRIAAEADGNGFNGNKYYNFSKIYKISADYSKIEAVDWDTL